VTFELRLAGVALGSQREIAVELGTHRQATAFSAAFEQRVQLAVLTREHLAAVARTGLRAFVIAILAALCD
jgi:hypothetical protein